MASQTDDIGWLTGMPAAALLISTTDARRTKLREELAAVGWLVETGHQPQELLGRLKDGDARVDAVFCDENLRGASPAGFLAWTRREKPRAKFWVFGDPQNWRGNLRPDGFLSWPPIRSELPVAPGTVVPTGDELSADDVPLSGSTAVMALEQLLDMLRTSADGARVRLHGGRGFVYVQKGTVLHANLQQEGSMLSGIGALAELLMLNDTDFAVEAFSKPSRLTINLPVMGAVSEAARVADERRRDRALIDWLQEAEPRLHTIAIGYHLGQQPDAGVGEADELFAMASKLLENTRVATGAAPRSLSVTGDRLSLAIHAFAGSRFVAVGVPARAGAALLRLLEKALKAIGSAD